MNGPTHRQLGFLAGAVAAAVTGHDLAGVVLSGGFASASAHGWLSPDVDQTGPWVQVRQWVRPVLPRRYERLMNHRYLSHWWGLPVAAAPAALTMPPEFSWATLMLIVGWASHLLGDFVFGEDPAGGIPVLPWGGGHVGLKLDTGGFWESGRARLPWWDHARKVAPAPAPALLTLGIVGVIVGSVLL